MVSIAASRAAGVGAALADETVSVAQAEERAGEQEPAPGEAAESAAGVEVIHVRGRGAGTIEADVPSSLTVFDSSTIQALGATDISKLTRVTPNVNIVQPGSTQATFFVR
ncbi:MAG: Plug domain-containing protein, partial [Deltaproteobacteria bacterium]